MRIMLVILFIFFSSRIYSQKYYKYQAQTLDYINSFKTDSLQSNETSSRSDTVAYLLTSEDMNKEMLLADSLLTQFGNEMRSDLKKRTLNYYTKLFSSWEKPTVFYFNNEKAPLDTTGKMVVCISDPEPSDYFADLMLNLNSASLLEIYIDRFQTVKEKIVKTKNILYLHKKNRKKEILFQRKSTIMGISNYFEKSFYTGHYRNIHYLNEAFENVYEFYLVTLKLDFPREYLIWFDENWNIIRFEEMRCPAFHVGYIVLKE